MNKLSAFIAAAMNMAFSNPAQHFSGRRSEAERPKHRHAGSKLAKKAKKHAIGLRNGPGGVISATFREIAQQLHQAKQANK